MVHSARVQLLIRRHLSQDKDLRGVEDLVSDQIDHVARAIAVCKESSTFLELP